MGAVAPVSVATLGPIGLAARGCRSDAASIIARNAKAFCRNPRALSGAARDSRLPRARDCRGHSTHAIRTEMQIFSKLIQRRERCNMIRTLFLGRLDHDRASRRQAAFLRPSNRPWRRYPRALQATGTGRCSACKVLSLAPAFTDRTGAPGVRRRHCRESAFWLEAEPVTDGKRALRVRLAQAYAVADKWRATFSEDRTPRARIICWSRSTASRLSWRALLSPPSRAPD